MILVLCMPDNCARSEKGRRPGQKVFRLLKRVCLQYINVFKMTCCKEISMTADKVQKNINKKILCVIFGKLTLFLHSTYFVKG